MDSVFDQAITDFYQRTLSGPLLINNKYGPPEEMSLEAYFRKEQDLFGLESYALSLCSGSVLDVGAGTGALSLILQSRGIAVEALEVSKICCDILRSRGITTIINQDFFSNNLSKRYDTLLMMMNGIGICGSLSLMPKLFASFDKLLKPGGQVLVDSSDVRYIYNNDLPKVNYFGEIDYQYEYNGKVGSWFKWLYVDIETLTLEAVKYGYHLQILSEDASGQYLGRLIQQ